MPGNGVALDEFEISDFERWISMYQYSEGGLVNGCSGLEHESQSPGFKRAWRLSPLQYNNVIKETFRINVQSEDTLPALIEVDGFTNHSNQGALTDNLFSSYEEMADEISLIAEDSAKMKAIWPCGSFDPSNNQCVQTFIEETGLKTL